MSAEYKEELLDSPLVVHKESDASYQETASEITMNSTHSDEEEENAPTLERHRFRKKKRSKKPVVITIAVIAVVAGVISALYYTGNIGAHKTVDEPTTKKSYTTEAENKFEGIITVKGTYIFFEGEEVDGLKGLEKKIKYLPKGTAFTIQDENADFNLLTLDESDKTGGSILSLLSMYELDYEITHIVSSGLMSKYEAVKTTEAPSETSKAKTTERTKPTSE